VLRGPHPPAASEAALDLVEDERRPGAVAQLPHAEEEAGGRHDDAAVSLDRLDERTRRRLDVGGRVGERVLEKPEPEPERDRSRVGARC
jgi:hypothetical protein